MNDPDDKATQKTPPGKAPPPRVADGPPETPLGEEVYDEATLEESDGYAKERSEESAKPYSTEVEDLAAKVARERNKGSR
jgi:hypothetical protein